MGRKQLNTPPVFKMIPTFGTSLSQEVMSETLWDCWSRSIILRILCDFVKFIYSWFRSVLLRWRRHYWGTVTVLALSAKARNSALPLLVGLELALTLACRRHTGHVRHPVPPGSLCSTRDLGKVRIWKRVHAVIIQFKKWAQYNI